MRIRASGLACVRGGREVFRDVSFVVGPGEALLVTGPNGAGKSSLLRLVAGLLRPAGGRIELESALAAVGLGALGRIPAIYLSAGQRRRLALARLIAIKRSIWLLDEPTAALDAAGRKMLADLLRTQLSNGGIVLAATHDPLGLENPMELRLGGNR